MALHRRRRGGTPPPFPGTPPSLNKVTIVGTNEIYRWENLVRPVLGCKILGPRPPPPLLLILPWF